jgi:hypothetical protein
MAMRVNYLVESENPSREMEDEREVAFPFNAQILPDTNGVGVSR